MLPTLICLLFPCSLYIWLRFVAFCICLLQYLSLTVLAWVTHPHEYGILAAVTRSPQHKAAHGGPRHPSQNQHRHLSRQGTQGYPSQQHTPIPNTTAAPYELTSPVSPLPLSGANHSKYYTIAIMDVMDHSPVDSKSEM